jgi:RecA-family ATPase
MTTDFTPADRDLLNELKKKYLDVPPETVEQKALHELLIIKRKAKERKTAWTATELLATEFPPIQWVIPDLIAPGLTVLAGAPKLGKSWMALSWALSVSSGGYALAKIPVQKMAVLYLALEDTPRRLKSRLQKLNATNRDNLHFVTEWNKKPSELSAYLTQYPEIRFVVVDTWGRFARVTDYNDYGESTGKAAELKKIADDFDVAVTVIHHARKGGKNDTGDFQDSVLGSTGLAGAADSTILLRRGRGTGKPNYWQPEGI